MTVLYKYALKEAKVVFFENEDNCRTLISSGAVSEERSCVLPGAGVDLERFSYQPYPADDGTFHFLFMGRIMKEKGVNELFAAMRRLRAEGKSCALDVLGFCEENYTDTITNYEKEGWLNYYGQQSDVRPFIARCHCFVLPSYHEGMANTNLECAAMGRPVITSNIPGCKEAVVDGESGYLCAPNNVESLYRCMNMMIGNKNRSEMGLIGRRHIEKMFDKQAVVEKTLDRLFG